MSGGSDLHQRFASWLLIGSPGRPPRDAAFHASACPECRLLVAAQDALTEIDLGLTPLPAWRAVPVPPGPAVRATRVATAVGAAVLLSVGGVGAAQFLGDVNGRSTTSVPEGTEPTPTPDQTVLGGLATPAPPAESEETQEPELTPAPDEAQETPEPSPSADEPTPAPAAEPTAPTPGPTSTATAQPPAVAPAPTPAPTRPPSATPAPTPAPAPTGTPSPTPAPTPTPTPVTPSPTSTPTPVPTPTAAPTSAPTPTPPPEEP